MEGKEEVSELEETGEGDKGLYMVMVAYAASNLKSYINELSGYRECVLSKHLEESALVAGMDYYIKIAWADTVGKSVEVSKVININCLEGCVHTFNYLWR